jgi:hypothetical protein
MSTRNMGIRPQLRRVNLRLYKRITLPLLARLNVLSLQVFGLRNVH